MKRTPTPNPRKVEEMASEYRFDYKKSEAKSFCQKDERRTDIVLLDDDVAKLFKTTDNVNNALRALISAMPK